MKRKIDFKALFDTDEEKTMNESIKTDEKKTMNESIKTDEKKKNIFTQGKIEWTKRPKIGDDNSKGTELSSGGKGTELSSGGKGAELSGGKGAELSGGKGAEPPSLVTTGEYGNLEQLLTEEWRIILRSEFKKPYWGKLMECLNKQYDMGKIIWPPKANIFEALNICRILAKIKVVILAQDPYPINATGLCFSSLPTTSIADIPKSLVTIFRELKMDMSSSATAEVKKDASEVKREYKAPINGCLKRWAEQGVLLLNCTMTVNEGEPNSHQSFGWIQFTDAVIKYISSKGNHIVFLLWGSFAHMKASMIEQKKHKVLKAPHPSPKSQGVFLGCKHFSLANAYLKSVNKEPIAF
jgi:uracil-DNA glycosylase